MGRVDLLDSLIALYRNKIRSKQLYHRLMFHFIDMTIVTAWLLYRRDCNSTGMRKEEQMKLYTFKSYIAESLWKSGKNLERKRGRHSSTIAGEYEEKRRRGPATPIPVPMCAWTPLPTGWSWMKRRGDARYQDAKVHLKPSAENVMSTSISHPPTTAS